MNEGNESALSRNEIIEMTARIAAAYLGANHVAPAELPNVIATVFAGLSQAGGTRTPEPVRQEPAVPIKKSVQRDYIVCLEDGKKLKMLKRHLRTVYGMTPAEYRAKWGLPPDYPMVAPAYAERRSEFAKQIGLGRSRKAAEPEPKAKAKAKPAARRGGRRKAAA